MQPTLAYYIHKTPFASQDDLRAFAEQIVRYGKPIPPDELECALRECEQTRGLESLVTPSSNMKNLTALDMAIVDEIIGFEHPEQADGMAVSLEIALRSKQGNSALQNSPLFTLLQQREVSSSELALLCACEVEKITSTFIESNPGTPMNIAVAALNQIASDIKIDLMAHQFTPILRDFAYKCLVVSQICSDDPEIKGCKRLCEQLHFPLLLLQSFT